MYKISVDQLTFAPSDELGDLGYPQRLIHIGFEGEIPCEPVVGKKMLIEMGQDAFTCTINDVYYHATDKVFKVNFDVIRHFIKDFGGELLHLSLMAQDALVVAGFKITGCTSPLYLIHGKSVAEDKMPWYLSQPSAST